MTPQPVIISQNSFSAINEDMPAWAPRVSTSSVPSRIDPQERASPTKRVHFHHWDSHSGSEDGSFWDQGSSPVSCGRSSVSSVSSPASEQPRPLTLNDRDHGNRRNSTDCFGSESGKRSNGYDPGRQDSDEEVRSSYPSSRNWWHAGKDSRSGNDRYHDTPREVIIARSGSTRDSRDRYHERSVRYRDDRLRTARDRRYSQEPSCSPNNGWEQSCRHPTEDMLFRFEQQQKRARDMGNQRELEEESCFQRLVKLNLHDDAARYASELKPSARRDRC